MLRKVKRIFTVILCLLCFAGGIPTVFADDGSSASEPATVEESGTRWTILQQAVLKLSYSNGTVTWGGQLIGNSNTMFMSAIFKLEKKNWLGIYTKVAETTTLNTNTMLLAFSSTYAGSTGSYRISFTGKVTDKSGNSENVSGSFEQKFT